MIEANRTNDPAAAPCIADIAKLLQAGRLNWGEAALLVAKRDGLAEHYESTAARDGHAVCRIANLVPRKGARGGV